MSVLVFSPARSLIRGKHEEKELKSIIVKPAIREEWGPCLQTLKGCMVSTAPLRIVPSWGFLEGGTPQGIEDWYESVGTMSRSMYRLDISTKLTTKDIKSSVREPALHTQGDS